MRFGFASGRVTPVARSVSIEQTSEGPPDRERALAALDAEILEAASEVDRTLIQLALRRTLRERLRAGASLARLAARFRAASLPTLIAVKAKTGRAKDRAVLPVLIATLEESSKKQP